MNPTKKKDILIVGGGMVGLSLASALSKANFSVAVIESREPTLQWEATDYDARVSAINLASYRFLNYLNVWQQLRKASISSIDTMTVWDQQGGGEIQFDAAEIYQDRLGYIVENREIIRVLWEQLSADPKVDLLCPEKAASVTIDKQHVSLKYSDAKTIHADLIVGADGGNSWLREQIDIDLKQQPYHHNAIVAVIKTTQPHGQAALQPFLKTGPLGVLPLAEPDHVSIVWSTNVLHSEELMSMTLMDFNRALTNALDCRLGQVHCLSERKSIPLVMRHAKQYVTDRVALAGDAAHTIHPLAGQGANLGFMDAACLAQTVVDAKEKSQDIGSLRVLRRYERWRKGDNTMMLLAMRSFKECFSETLPLLVTLRTFALNATNRLSLLKKCFIKLAMNDSDDLPESAK